MHRLLSGDPLFYHITTISLTVAVHYRIDGIKNPYIVIIWDIQNWAKCDQPRRTQIFSNNLSLVSVVVESCLLKAEFTSFSSSFAYTYLMDVITSTIIELTQNSVHTWGIVKSIEVSRIQHSTTSLRFQPMTTNKALLRHVCIWCAYSDLLREQDMVY